MCLYHWAGGGEQEELLAALREPGDVAHHEQPREGGASTAAHDLGRRFEEMDFDHDFSRCVPLGAALACRPVAHGSHSSPCHCHLILALRCAET